jgi:hypothetical protein
MQRGFPDGTRQQRTGRRQEGDPDMKRKRRDGVSQETGGNKVGQNGDGDAQGPNDGQRRNGVLPAGGALLATMIKCLREEGQIEEAKLLANCQLEFGGIQRINGDHYSVDVTLRVRLGILKRLTTTTCYEDEPERMRRVRNALRVSLPGGYKLGVMDARVIPAGMRKEERPPGNGQAGKAVRTKSIIVSEVRKREGESEHAMEAVRETEAQRVFRVLTLLRTEPRKRKAPLHTVFEFAVLQGLAGKDVAKACGCAPSLVSRRMTTMEKRFGMSVKRLRNYVADIREIETTVKGERGGGDIVVVER